jgi:hypothetical protein
MILIIPAIISLCFFSIFNYAKVRKIFKASEDTEQLNYATIQ